MRGPGHRSRLTPEEEERAVRDAVGNPDVPLTLIAKRHGMTPTTLRMLMEAARVSRERPASSLSGFGAAMTWKDFDDWLTYNNVLYSPGDMHYAGRGWWFPVAPDTRSGDENPLPPEPWLRVSKDQENPNVRYINTSYGRHVMAEHPEVAQVVVGEILMEFNELFGLDALPPPEWYPDYVPEPREYRGRPMGPAGEAMQEQLRQRWQAKHGPGIARRAEQRAEEARRIAEGRPYIVNRGQSLEGYEDDASSSCELGAHERCNGCGCGCHMVKRCSCGRRYTRAQWERLPSHGVQLLEAEGLDEACRMEVKNCASCGSTLYVEVD